MSKTIKLVRGDYWLRTRYCTAYHTREAIHAKLRGRTTAKPGGKQGYAVKVLWQRIFGGFKADCKFSVRLLIHYQRQWLLLPWRLRDNTKNKVGNISCKALFNRALFNVEIMAISNVLEARRGSGKYAGDAIWNIFILSPTICINFIAQ